MASFAALVHSYYRVYINYAGSVSTLELEHVFYKLHGTENNIVMCVESVIVSVRMHTMSCEEKN